MSTDKADAALKYVCPIMNAYTAAESAGETALHHALECGNKREEAEQ